MLISITAIKGSILKAISSAWPLLWIRNPKAKMIGIQSFFALWSLITLLAAAAKREPLMPSSITCFHSRRKTIVRNDCRLALNQFHQEDNTITWTSLQDSHSCGTCRITLKEPSQPASLSYSFFKGDAITAFQQAIDQCPGVPSNSTIGKKDSLLVLIDYGDGKGCWDTSRIHPPIDEPSKRVWTILSCRIRLSGLAC